MGWGAGCICGGLRGSVASSCAAIELHAGFPWKFARAAWGRGGGAKPLPNPSFRWRRTIPPWSRLWRGSKANQPSSSSPHAALSHQYSGSHATEKGSWWWHRPSSCAVRLAVCDDSSTGTRWGRRGLRSGCVLWCKVASVYKGHGVMVVSRERSRQEPRGASPQP